MNEPLNNHFRMRLALAIVLLAGCGSSDPLMDGGMRADGSPTMDGAMADSATDGALPMDGAIPTDAAPMDSSTEPMTCDVNGYGPTGTEHGLPSGNYPIPQDAVHCSYRGHYEDDTYFLSDFDGDGLVDLMVTDECDASNGVGRDHWLLYRNVGGRFTSEPSQFALPPGNYPVPQDTVHCSYRGHYEDDTYFLSDFDGDGRPDLIVTDECDANNAVGTGHWLVYANTGDGFASTPTEFALPPGNYPVPQDTVHCSYRGHYEDDTYFLSDFNGDGRPDLVVTDECDANNAVGTDHWLVYENGGDGFASTATMFGLPEGNYPIPQDAVHCSYRGHYEDDTYFLSDFDGDGRPDLVVTDECDANNSVGTDHWLVYGNTGDRFAATATTFGLPAGNYPVPQDFVHCSYRGHYEDDTYFLSDLDGDGRPDLVVTDECDANNAVGTEHWLMYTNGGDGFAPMATQVGLPAGSYPTPQDSVHCSYRGHYEDDTYALLHMTTDARPDLVITQRCDAGGATGTAHWEVFPMECAE